MRIINIVIINVLAFKNAEAVLVSKHSSAEEMSLILRQEEEKRLLAASEDRDKKE